MDLLAQALDIFLHLDEHLNHWAGLLGPWLYALLFVVIFCETGLVVTPFLPGDSLLFAVGALCSLEGSTLSLPLMQAANGLPLGVQLVGRRGFDARLLRTARWLAARLEAQG